MFLLSFLSFHSFLDFLLCVYGYDAGWRPSSCVYTCSALIYTFNLRESSIYLSSSTTITTHVWSFPSLRHSQLLFYTQNPNLAHSLTKAFTYLLPLGGILGIPFVGFLLDKRSVRDAILVLAILGVVFGTLGMTSTPSAQIISIATLTILRPLMYTAISDFSAKWVQPKLCLFLRCEVIYTRAVIF